MASPPPQRLAGQLLGTIRRITDRLQERAGQGMVEYAFILMMVAVALLIIVSVIGKQTANMYNNITNGFTGH